MTAGLDADTTHAVCPVCQCAIREGEAEAACPACGTRYHGECWEENGGCAVYGCSRVPPTEKLSELEIPPSYWGQANKPCPACGAEILAAAIRCRHCGTVFESARPETGHDLARRNSERKSVPAVKKQAVAIFLVCLCPCTALPGALVGLFWYRKNRDILRRMPAAWPALGVISVGIGFTMALLFFLMTALYAFFRS